MRRLDLQEYVRSDPVPLFAAERDELGDILTSLTIEPASGAEGAYHLTPGSTVGALDIGDLSVSIRPKLDIARVLFLASYAMGAFDLREERFDFQDAPTLVEALASALAAAARRAFRSRAAPRVPDRGGGAAHRARPNPHRRPTPTQVWRPRAGRGPLRRVHRRHHGEPSGEGGRRTVRPAAAALAAFPRRSAVGRRTAGECVAGRVPRRA